MQKRPPPSSHQLSGTMSSSKASSECSSDTDGDVCWVCLSDDQQLQSAGKSEEKVCRFCMTALPDWREGVTPEGLRPASPIMSIHHNGETFMVKVAPGPDGLRQFQESVRTLLNLGDDQDFDISFECRVPGANTATPKMELKGMNAYDAAVYCASITAAERLQLEKGNPSNEPTPDPEATPARHTIAAPAQLQSTQSYPCISPSTSPVPDPRAFSTQGAVRPRTGSEPLIPLPATPVPHSNTSRRAPYLTPERGALTNFSPFAHPSIAALRALEPSPLLAADLASGGANARRVQPQGLEPNASLGCTLRRRVVSPDASSSSSAASSDDERVKDNTLSGNLVLPSGNPFTSNVHTQGSNLSNFGQPAFPAPTFESSCISSSRHGRFASNPSSSNRSSRSSSNRREALDALCTSLAQARHSTTLYSLRNAAITATRELQAIRERRANSDCTFNQTILEMLPAPPSTTLNHTYANPSSATDHNSMPGALLSSAFDCVPSVSSESSSAFAVPAASATSVTAMSAFASMQQLMADEDLLGSFPTFDTNMSSPATAGGLLTSDSSQPPLLATAGSSRSMRSATLSGQHSLTPPQPLPLPTAPALPYSMSGLRHAPHHLQSSTSGTPSCLGPTPRYVPNQEMLYARAGRQGRYAGASPGATNKYSYAQRVARSEQY